MNSGKQTFSNQKSPVQSSVESRAVKPDLRVNNDSVSPSVPDNYHELGAKFNMDL